MRSASVQFVIGFAVIAACFIPVRAEEAAVPADATAELQKRIDATRGLVDLPAGTFTISESLVVNVAEKGYRGIRGANGATRIVMTGPGPAIKIIGKHGGTADPKSVMEHTWEKERFPVVSGLEVLGKHPEADGIALQGTMQCTVQNVLIRNCRYGIHLIERNRNFLLADSHIYDGGDTGVFFDHCNLHQTNIIGNHISYNKRAGIRQLNGDVHNIQITGNDIEYNAGAEEGLSGEIVLESVDTLISEYTISSNTIQAIPENRGANIYIVGDVTKDSLAARAIAITGNVIGSREKSIYIENATRTAISGNTIYGGTQLNVHLKKCRNIVLGNNNIGTRPSMHDITKRYADGVLLEGCRDSIVNGNVISGAQCGSADSGGAVTLLDSSYCRVSDCQILDPKFRGVWVEGGEANVISDNTIAERGAKAMVEAVVVTEGGADHLVQGNLVKSSLADPIAIAEGAGDGIGNIIRQAKDDEAPAQ